MDKTAKPNTASSGQHPTQHHQDSKSSRHGANPENRKQPRHTDSKPKTYSRWGCNDNPDKTQPTPADSMLREEKPADAEEDWKNWQEKAKQRQNVPKIVRQQPDRTENSPNSNWASDFFC